MADKRKGPAPTDPSTKANDENLVAAAEIVKRIPQAHLFPIRKGAKFPPLFKNNLLAASCDISRISYWSRKWPGCNWGVALKLSRLLVVDVDCKPGQPGLQSYTQLEAQHGFPLTLTVQTPSGGRHLYYNGPHIFKLGFAPGLDSPNYVLTPGSRTPAGAYKIIDDLPLADAPLWLYELIGAPRARVEVGAEPVIELDQPFYIAWAKDYLQHDAPAAIEGQGGELCTLKVAMMLRDNGISEPMCRDLVAEFYNPRCEPPWKADDLDRKIANAYRYANLRPPGAATVGAEFASERNPFNAAMRRAGRDAYRAAAYTEIDGELFPVIWSPGR